MANRSDLASRVSSLLDQNRPRGRAGASAVIVATAAACVMVLALAPLRAVTRPIANMPLATAVEVSSQASRLNRLPLQQSVPASRAALSED